MKKIICLFVMMIQLAHAETQLDVHLEFTSRAPFSGIVYVEQDSQHSNNIVDQKNKAFDQPIYVVDANEDITFRNSDTTDHNIYANDIKSGVKFDIGLLASNQEKKLAVDNWPKDTFVRIGCKIHPKMRAYISTIKNKIHQTLIFDPTTKTSSASLQVNSDENYLWVWFAGYEAAKFEVDHKRPKTYPILRKGKQRGTITITPVQGEH